MICQLKATLETRVYSLGKPRARCCQWHRRLGHAGYESLVKIVEGPGLLLSVEVKAEL